MQYLHTCDHTTSCYAHFPATCIPLCHGKCATVARPSLPCAGDAIHPELGREWSGTRDYNGARQSGTGLVARQELVTPLRQSTSTNAVQQQRSSTGSIATRPAVNLQLSMSKIQQQFTLRKVDKVLLKAVNKKGKKDP